jgi:hypothetical protein
MVNRSIAPQEISILPGWPPKLSPKHGPLEKGIVNDMSEIIGNGGVIFCHQHQHKAKTNRRDGDEPQHYIKRIN